MINEATSSFTIVILSLGLLILLGLLFYDLGGRSDVNFSRLLRLLPQ